MSTAAPPAPSSVPAVRAPRRRARSEEAYSVSAVMLTAACTAPARRMPSSTGSLSAQSFVPVKAVGR